jgi:hypothetical protein
MKKNLIESLTKEGYFEIMKYRRAHETAGNKAFVKDVLMPQLKKFGKPKIDKAGNVILQYGDSRTVFSSHHDTMHNRLNDKVFQKLKIDENLMHLTSDGRECLGADDGSGMWLMLMLLAYGVSGLYIFHAGEERVGIGSSYIARNTPELLEGYERAIAFDRAYTSHIITHQFGKRLASKKAARFLAQELNTLSTWETKFAPNDGGIFTDTANYQTLIPECFNLSVGYYAQHTGREYQDLRFLWKLSQILPEVDWESMPTERDPKAPVKSKWEKDIKPFCTPRSYDEPPMIYQDDWVGNTIVTERWVKDYAHELAEFFSMNDISEEYLMEAFGYECEDFRL